jgi:HSP20 family protein
MSNTAIEKRENNNDKALNVNAQRAEQATYFTPLVDVVETGDEFTFWADLPGVKAGDVDVSYENGTLTLQGKVYPRQPAAQSYLWHEYDVGHYYRQFSLGPAINPDGIRAELKNGVLELHVPKAESAKTRKIEIKTT